MIRNDHKYHKRNMTNLRSGRVFKAKEAKKTTNKKTTEINLLVKCCKEFSSHWHQ